MLDREQEGLLERLFDYRVEEKQRRKNNYIRKRGKIK